MYNETECYDLLVIDAKRFSFNLYFDKDRNYMYIYI